MSSWVIRIGIVAAIVIGGFVLRDRLSSNAGELKIGDCFDEPAGITDISDVQHHPCTEPHTDEVIFVGDMSGDSGTYPVSDVFDQFAAANCLTAFTTYTGRNFETEQELTLSYFVPNQEGWSNGKRQMICYAIRVDGQPMKQSVKAQ